MTNRNGWRGHPYCAVRGKTLGSAQDKQLRKHLPRLFYWLRAKVRGSKMIRYHPSSDPKRCRLAIGQCCFIELPVSFREIKVWVLREVWLQSWNLKELTEVHHQVRLNLTRHGKSHPARTQRGMTDWELFLDSVGGGAWPFLVCGAICLVNSDNERDSYLLNSWPSFGRGTFS